MPIQQMMMSTVIPMSATASPALFNVVGSTATVNTPGETTVTVVGATSTPSFAWTRNDGVAINALSPSSASTAFQATGMLLGETRSTSFTCTVTAGGQIATVVVPVTMTRNP